MSSLDKFIREEKMHPVYAIKFAFQEQYINELQQRIDKAIGCIEKFLCTEEYIKVNGEAIANNYQEVLEKLKGVDK